MRPRSATASCRRRAASPSTRPRGAFRRCSRSTTTTRCLATHASLATHVAKNSRSSRMSYTTSCERRRLRDIIVDRTDSHADARRRPLRPDAGASKFSLLSTSIQRKKQFDAAAPSAVIVDCVRPLLAVSTQQLRPFPRKGVSAPPRHEGTWRDGIRWKREVGCGLAHPPWLQDYQLAGRNVRTSAVAVPYK